MYSSMGLYLCGIYAISTFLLTRQSQTCFPGHNRLVVAVNDKPHVLCTGVDVVLQLFNLGYTFLKTELPAL
jgi:hypothetical protein